MDEVQPEESPGALLDALNDHPEWGLARRDEQLDRLVARFPPEELAGAIGARLCDLSGVDAEAVLRLVEAIGSEELLDGLAEALRGQPDLPSEREWEALAVLDGAGWLDGAPDLAERWEELNEAIGDDAGSIGDLVADLEDDPEEVWVALHGLGAVEPEVRAAIVAGLADAPAGPGLVEFLRLLAHAHDPQTRAAAVAALEAHDADDPLVAAAWAALAADHDDPGVAAKARRAISGRWANPAGASLPAGAAPRIVRCLVTAVDGRGRGEVVIEAIAGGRRATAAFECDVVEGVVEVVGHLDAAGAFDEHAGRLEVEAVEGLPPLALGLLAAAMLRNGPATNPALRYWVERTAGPGFRPAPFPGLFGGWDPADVSAEETAARAVAVLDACPGWEDDSPTIRGLAGELLGRDPTARPDPVREAGAYRFAFEHRLLGLLPRYAAMLGWMAAYWHGVGEVGLGRSALALAWQLADAQHAVPGHPFAAALTTRSLEAAMARLRGPSA